MQTPTALFLLLGDQIKGTLGAKICRSLRTVRASSRLGVGNASLRQTSLLNSKCGSDSCPGHGQRPRVSRKARSEAVPALGQIPLAFSKPFYDWLHRHVTC